MIGGKDQSRQLIQWQGERWQRPAAGLRSRIDEQPALGLGMRTPQHENDRMLTGYNGLNNGVSECFPTLLCVAGGLALFYRETGVQQQHTLLSPGLQRPVGRARQFERSTRSEPQGRATASATDRACTRAITRAFVSAFAPTVTHAPRIPRDFLKNISQRWRQRNTWSHGERQPLRLARPVVRVLPQDDHFDTLKRRQFQRPKRLRRIDSGPLCQAVLHEAAQALRWLAAQKMRDDGLPVLRHGPVLGLPMQQ